MIKKYDNAAIEAKWRKIWEEKNSHDTGERDNAKEKQYILVELPYPSGNLHIGHWYAFAVPDIYVRFLRMTGVQVMYPMGFDAFGLPAENAAIKRDLNPREWTESNIAYMKKQLASMGNAFSWDKTASTIDPHYYRWTQWMFTKFFEKGIAYRGEAIVNWDPVDNTVIANEQVLPDGTSERSGAVIEKKRMPQWMLRITDYADRLVDDLDELDWPEHIKEAQRQWIGRSKGARLTFTLSTGDTVDVFTTRPDTLFGATYLVLAPEHPLLKTEQVRGRTSNLDEVDAYIHAASQHTEQDRLDATREKTGVQLKGVTATNPGSREEIPVYIADYVLGGYGTGAIMAVPAHDERDYAFAEAFSLPIVPVISGDEAPYSGPGTLQNSGSFNGMDSEEAKAAVTRKIDGELTNTYRLRDWSVGRQRYWGVPIPIVYDPDGTAHAVPEEHLPWTLPEDVDFHPTGEPPLAKSKELKQRTEQLFGAGWTPEVETMDTFVDSSWYFLRYIDNQCETAPASLEAQREWMPVDLYFGGAEHTTMHLLYSRFWQKALFDLGVVTTEEPYQRRINRGLILGPDGNKMSKSKGNVIDPDEQVAWVGADAVKMYLAFMGPYEGSNYPWDTGGIAGIRRFLERVYGLTEHITNDATRDTEKLLHKTIDKVRSDITEFKFNTAISTMMIFVNQAEKTGLSTDVYETFVKVLAPFAPFLTEEIWATLGHTDSVHTQPYPTADAGQLVDETVTIGVQVNGKHRGAISIAPSASEDEAFDAAISEPTVAKYLVSHPHRVIYIPGRILNLIVDTET